MLLVILSRNVGVVDRRGPFFEKFTDRSCGGIRVEETSRESGDGMLIDENHD